ncbi:O-antigen ligase family protein [Paenibacillus beijingensis]|uniref:O-antigen ligase-related domain-containing protein n=1 Tax=Paenibacillus beijingensis TaxID=1126833 RepID=A0A0D5NKC2_9BACL|nr:O-antigen ligase family protein [Paenibacillus beijingensis]AJY75681.1 hypothetical protein VN24_15365 [Paenibacillus beijingensis]
MFHQPQHNVSVSRPWAAVSVCLLAACFLGYAAYRSGMFFDGLFYRWEALLCALAAARLLTKRWMRQNASRRPGTMPISHGAIAGICALTFLYALSLLGRPASVQGTLEQILRWSAYGAYLVLLLDAARLRGFAPVWTSALLLSGHFAVFGALAGWLGWLHFPDIVMRTGDSELSATGARLAGFFQYANMLGAVAGALLLWQWSLLVQGSGFWPRLLARVGAVPYALVLLLTESRGAWIAAAAGWLLGLLVIGAPHRRRWLLLSAWTMLLAGLAYRLVYRTGAALTGEGALAPGGAGYRAAAGLLPEAAAESGLLHRVLELWPGSAAAGVVAVIAAAVAGAAGLRLLEAARLTRRRGALLVWLVPPLCAALLAALLPAALHGRIGAHYETGAARMLFYRDALALAQQAPLLGQGGGVWRTLFQSVQSRPYAGSEVHSGYLDTLLNTGAAGLAVLTVMACSLCLMLWKQNRALLAPVLTLLLHAAVDIDMSYGYYWLLLFGLAAAGAAAPAGEANGIADPGEGAGSSAAAPAGEASGIADPGEGAGSSAAAPGGEASGIASPGGVAGSSAARRAAALLAALWLAAASLGGWQLDRAQRLREAAAAASGSARIALLRAAVAANPAWTRIRTDLAQLVPPGERASLLAAGLRYEPQSAPLQWELGETYAELGDLPRAEAALRAAARLDRFGSAKRTEALQVLERLAQRQLAAGSAGAARQTALAALSLYSAYAELDREVRGMSHPANGRRFALTAEAEQTASRCLELLRRTEKG